MNSNRPTRIRKRINFSRTYGLRPRTEIRRPSYECDAEEKEVFVERKPTRGRGRSSLMTKYRRKTANERERHRMKEINDAFTTLRGILPAVYTKKSAQVSMTKIRILKLAASYIEALSDLLSDDETSISGKTIDRAPDHFSCTSCTVQQLPSITTTTQKVQDSQFLKQKVSQASNEKGDKIMSFSDCLTEGKNTKLKVNDENMEFVVNNCECDILSFLGDVAAIEGSVSKWEMTSAIDELCFSIT